MSNAEKIAAQIDGLKLQIESAQELLDDARAANNRTGSALASLNVTNLKYQIHDLERNLAEASLGE